MYDNFLHGVDRMILAMHACVGFYLLSADIVTFSKAEASVPGGSNKLGN